MASKPRVRAYPGDAKTLLAFDLPKAGTKNLAGFTISCQPEGQEPYFLHNTLRFENPRDHAQDPREPVTSSINAPFHKFRWLHVPGSVHQGLAPAFGPYTYTVTARHFDDAGSLEPLDPALGTSVKVDVGPFAKGSLRLGFTRGFVQSQAFVGHFGLKAAIRPKDGGLIYDTKKISGRNAAGESFTYAEQYDWLGFTARKRIFEVLDEVVADPALRLDVFAYDLNEPDIVSSLLKLGRQGRVRIILDNAALHRSTAEKDSPEDQFEQEFRRVARDKGSNAILRGHFGRYAHDKVLLLSDRTGPRTVLTGSTNFSVTGLYVNSNHVLVFDDRKVAAKYAALFAASWDGEVKRAAFLESPLSSEVAAFSGAGLPNTSVTFAPHEDSFAESVLEGLVSRISDEGRQGRDGSVLFAVMEVGKGTGPVYPALQRLHRDQNIFSYGVSDTTEGVSLYKPGRKDGVLVTGKPTRTRLPPPFNQVPGIGGVGHQIHHKFVVCGFNGEDPTVYCGSSNLALGGETDNGDNLLEIHDRDVATAFAVEAVALVDHFSFLDRFATAAPGRGAALREPPANKAEAASEAHWFLSRDAGWTQPYYEASDLRFTDRKLFCPE